MKSIPSATVFNLLLFALLLSVTSSAQDPARGDRKKAAAPAPTGAPAAKDSDPRSADTAVLRKSAQEFCAAFNRGDAKAVAALWTKDGEYVDDDGQRFAGRAAIEAVYARFFAGHPGAKMTVVVDSIRLVSDNTAIEDGRGVVEIGRGGGPSHSKYTVVHAKVDGRWLMSSVRDAQIASPAGGEQLQDLEWLIGTWTAEENGAKMELVCRWIANRGFIERDYSVKRGDKLISSGVQIIGWNPQIQRVQSWTFSSDGGSAVGVWVPRKNGWAVEMSGMLADGTPSEAVNEITRIDDGAVSWRSVDRAAGGVQLPDAEEVLLKRVAAKR